MTLKANRVKWLRRTVLPQGSQGPDGVCPSAPRHRPVSRAATACSDFRGSTRPRGPAGDRACAPASVAAARRRFLTRSRGTVGGAPSLGGRSHPPACAPCRRRADALRGGVTAPPVRVAPRRRAAAAAAAAAAPLSPPHAPPHSNAAQSSIDIPRELRNTCPMRDFQRPPKPVTLKRYINICLSISGRNGSLNVLMYQCFVDKGTLEEKWTQWLLPIYTLPPPCGYRRLVHHALPHKVHLTCLPLLQDNSTCAALTPPLTPSHRLDIHHPPSPQAQPSHLRRSRPSVHTDTTLLPNKHIRRALCVKETPKPAFPRTRRTKESRQRRAQGRASGVRNSTVTLTSPHPSSSPPRRPLPHHPDTDADIAAPHTTPPWTTLLPNNHIRQALCVRRTPIPTNSST